MKKPIPFYYEVRFRLSSYDRENNIVHQSRKVEFLDENPINARQQAFEEFDEFLSYPMESGRVVRNKRGNLEIFQPTFLIDRLNKMKEEDFVKWYHSQNGFREVISVFLVVSDPQISHKVLQEDEDDLRTEFELHRVCSGELDSEDEQGIIDNLELRELELFTHYNCDTHGYEKVTYHYGEDYYDTGCNVLEGAARKILPTPHIWELEPEEEIDLPTTKQQLKPESESKEEIKTKLNFDYKDVIAGGESKTVEFKPALVYNFKSGAYAMGVLNIIAKTINGFLNAKGGTLLIGVNDSGEIQGIANDLSVFEGDYQKQKDKVILEVDKLISKYFGLSESHLIYACIEHFEGKDVLVIEVEESSKPVVMNGWNGSSVVEQMFTRLNASTRELKTHREIAEYVHSKSWKSKSN